MADVTATVRAVVAVVDKATAPLRAIQSQFKSFGAGISGMGAKLKAFGDSAPIQRIGGALKNVGSAARGVVGNLTRILAPIAGLAGVAGIGGLTAALHKFTDEGERLLMLSAATGETVEHLQELEHWADMSGVSAESLARAITKTNKTAGEAATGKNKKAAKAFADLGISIKDSAGHVRTFGEIAPTLADHFSRMKSATARARLGNQLFGKSWAEIVPLLAQGRGALEQATEEARKHGLMSKADAEAGDRLGDAQQNLQKSIAGVAMAIAKKLAPALTPLIEEWGNWLDLHRETLRDDILQRLEAVADAFKSFAEQVGGTANALKIFGGLIAALVFAPLIQALAGLAAALIGAAAAAGLFNLAMLPVLLGLGLIAAAAWLLAKNWDTVREKGNALFAALAAGIDPVVAAIDQGVQAIDAAFRSAFDALFAWAAGAWAGLATAVLAVLDGLGAGIAKAWAAIWAGLSSTAATIAGDLRGQFNSVLQFFDDLAGVALRVFARIGEAWASLTSGFALAAPAPGGLAAAAGAGARGPGLAAAGGAAGAPGAAGNVDVTIHAPNQPPGTRISTKTSGKNLQSRANVGYSMPQLVPAGAQ